MPKNTNGYWQVIVQTLLFGRVLIYPGPPPLNMFNPRARVSLFHIFELPLAFIMHIQQYSAKNREQCLAIFKSNTPRYFDPNERAALENWLDGKDQGRHSYQSNLAEHFYVALADNQVVACGGFYIPKETRYANLVWGMVENARHKRGIGTSLLKYRLEQIKTLYPACPVKLDTSQHTCHFFERFGFRVTTITHDAYGPDLHRYDMVLG